MAWTEEQREQDAHENRLKWQRDMQQIEADLKGLGKLFGEIKALEFVLDLPPMPKQQYLSLPTSEWYYHAKHLRVQLGLASKDRTPFTHLTGTGTE